MGFLDYLKAVHTKSRETGTGTGQKKFAIHLITNFTDGVLQKILGGALLTHGIDPDIVAVPYQQHNFFLTDKKSFLWRQQADVTFIFFDEHPYKYSPFMEGGYWENLLSNIKRYIKYQKGPVIMCTFITPYHNTYGNLFEHDPLYRFIEEANSVLKQMRAEFSNFHVCDLDALIHIHGEKEARDIRGLYAFDTPFTNTFLTVVAESWYAYVRAMTGAAKKCIVADLDNTLWGGVVGEVGPLGISLGPDYPGSAYQAVQRALLNLYGRGVILALNSKNNPADVAEVFARNQHMILKEDHFAAVRINWQDKATNIMEIADELNIGLDSMVFLDDDPVNRGLVRKMLPQVFVPELPENPEEYVPLIHRFDLFNQFNLSHEDLQKSKMYADERKRIYVREAATSIEDYIKDLGIQIIPEINKTDFLPRIAQLTQKTNQFNLTTRRYTEKELENMIKAGDLICAAEVSDRFGSYGKTIMAIVKLKKGSVAELDTFLMSCRVMGRGVETAFLGYVAGVLAKKGVKRLAACFIPSPKNKPAENFLSSSGFKLVTVKADISHYEIDTALLTKGVHPITIQSTK